MAGSKGGKHSKKKGKSKSNKSDTINKKSEVSNSKIDLAQTSNIDPDGPIEPKDKNHEPDISLALSTSRSSYTENELEEFLYIKLEVLYTRAKERLLKFGYGMAEVETAILHAGYFHGEMDLLNNVLKNSIAYIEDEVRPTIEAFEDMNELYKSMLETMVQSVMQSRKGIERSDAVWYLLIRNWGCFPPTTTTPYLQRGDMNSILVHESNESSSLNKNEDAGAIDLSSAEKALAESQNASSIKKVGIFERINLTPALECYLRLKVLILTASVERKIGDVVIRQQAKPTEVPDILSSDFLRTIAGCSNEASLTAWLESNSDDPKTALIVDLVKNMRELHKKVKEQKEWAQKKVIDSARRLSKDLLELKMLRVEKFDQEKNKNEKMYAKKLFTLMLMEAEQSLRKANSEVSFLTESVTILATKNAEIRADIEAIKLQASGYEEDLKGVLKRERRYTKKLLDVEKQASIFQSQIEEGKQSVLQLEVELLHAEKEADQTEKKWRQEIKEKERMYALLAEEIKMAEIQKANSRAQLLKLKQKVEIDNQLARDDLQRLEDELSCLHMSRQMPNILLEDENFWSESVGASSSASSAPYESSGGHFRHWICMMCLQNEVSMVFLPCKHQVLCSPCYSENFKTVGGRCPYCQIKIEESIRVYGRSS